MSRNEDRIVRFSGIKPGIYDYRIVLGDDFFGEFENEEIEGGNVEFDVRMERTERVTMLTFTFHGHVATRCDRCLGPMQVEVAGEEHLNVRFSDTEQSDDESIVVLPEDAFELDLGPWLYEYVAVRLPMQHVHPDGECDPDTVKYIADEANSKDDDYVDPRWEALKKLK